MPQREAGGHGGARRVIPAGNLGLESNISVACNVFKMLVFAGAGAVAGMARLKLDMVLEVATASEGIARRAASSSQLRMGTKALVGVAAGSFQSHQPGTGPVTYTPQRQTGR